MQFFQQVIQRETIVNSALKYNIKKFKLIHIYKFGKKKNSNLNFFSKAVPIKNKSLKINKYKKKKYLSIIIRSKEWTNRIDGSYRKFFENTILPIQKKIKNKIIGSTIIEVYRKKKLFLFKNIF